MNGSIWPIDGTLIGTTTLVLSEPGSNDFEEVLHTHQVSSTLPSYAVYVLMTTVEVEDSVIRDISLLKLATTTYQPQGASVTVIVSKLD